MTNLKYRPDIDGLRALAILLVVIFHFDIFSLGKAGFIGVDIFFVISGYLITSIILNDLHQGTFSLKDFYYRRVRRLYPALIATLFLYSIYAYFFFLPQLFEEFAIEAILSQLYVVNIYFWRTVNYFGLQASSVPLLHMWSLAIEEQFYLFFPLFMLVIFKFRKSWLGGLLILITLASFVLGLIMVQSKPEASFYLLPTRAWELLIGSLIAFYGRFGWSEKLPFGAMGVLGIVLVICAVYIYNPSFHTPGFYTLLPTVGAALLIIGNYKSTTGVSRFFAQGVLVFIGKISYPLYLVHWPVLIALKDGVEDYSLMWRLVGVGLSFFLAYLIYAFVETPVRTKKVLGGAKPYLGVTGASVAGLLIFAVIAQQSNGLQTRFSPEVNDILRYAEADPAKYHGCVFRDQNPDRVCRFGDGTQKTSILAFGDSHAISLAPALDRYARATRQYIKFNFYHSCLPIPGIGQPRCLNYSDTMIERALNDPTISHVMMISVWRQPFQEKGALIDGVWTQQPAARLAFQERLVQLNQKLQAAGKTLIVVEPLFSAPHSVPETMAKNMARNTNWDLNVTLADHDAYFASFNEALDQIKAHGALSVSLIDDLCFSGTCMSAINGKPLFRDNNHLANWTGDYFARLLEVKLDLETP